MIFIALMIVGTANFIPTTSRVIQKKEITLSLYEFARTSLIIVFFLYLVQVFGFLTTPVLTFNAHSIVDLYTQTLKIIVILIT